MIYFKNLYNDYSQFFALKKVEKIIILTMFFWFFLIYYIYSLKKNLFGRVIKLKFIVVI